MTVNKKSLSERDICTKFITPAIVERAGWSRDAQLREEVSFTKGRIIVKGKLSARGEQKRADYVLYHKPNLPVAIVEAKDNRHNLEDGLQQAIDYAETMDVPFAYSSNGDGFIEHDRTITSGEKERFLRLDEFPTPAELWQRYCRWKNIADDAEKIYTQDYYPTPDNKTPRYYQLTAINSTVEAIAKGQNRVLLVMATGTGKTFTAFQIIWRLWKSAAKKRILFLADRNILVDQTRNNDFQPFGAAMTKIENRTVDKSYEIYLGLYQAMTGAEDAKNIFRQFSPDFFDLIVIDECHRGSADENSSWREILEYFKSATQIGLTATPKETKDVSTTHYFGDPVFTYSLKQGIEDGFLAPYKVVRYTLDKDLDGWQPELGKLDKFGNKIENRVYNQRDYDNDLILERRTKLVAEKITEFLRATNPFDKTIVFCENEEHAGRMRSALVNANAALVAENSRYVMRITGSDHIGKAELDNFILPDSRYPVIVTTAELLSTGVDAQTCKLIVLDKRIESMTKFKQIIGRGTRIREDYGKSFFTIMDFRNATQNFHDPAFDGEPVRIYEFAQDEPPTTPDDEPDAETEPTDNESDKPKKYYVADVEVSVVAEQVSYYGKDGALTTESLKDYTRKNVAQNFASLDEFLRKWTAADKKEVIIAELEAAGVLFEALQHEVGKDFDAFDLICHVAFGQKPLTRRERAENVKKRDYFAKYKGEAREVLEILLDKFADNGVEQIEKPDVIESPEIGRFGRKLEIHELFGGKVKFQDAVRELKTQIYAAA